MREELDFLKTHNTISQGMRGETLTATLLNGTITSYAESWDVTLQDGAQVEVKFSKLHKPSKSLKTRRWVWGKVFGESDHGKTYDWLLLIGDKDCRFPNQYPDQSPYVFFLVPKANVSKVASSSGRNSLIQLSTNFDSLWSSKDIVLLEYRVDVEQVAGLIGNQEVHVAKQGEND